ncbi:hypothetical protein R4036_004578 [Salmonella enterica]|nr:hypothetical protein [Salmonella enterica]
MKLSSALEYQTRLLTDARPFERYLRASRAYGRKKMARYWSPESGFTMESQLITPDSRARMKAHAERHRDWLDLNTPENLHPIILADLDLPPMLNDGLNPSSSRCNFSPASGEEAIRLYQMRRGWFAEFPLSDRAASVIRCIIPIYTSAEIEGLLMRFRGFASYRVADACPTCGSMERVTDALMPATGIRVSCRGCKAETRKAAKIRRAEAKAAIWTDIEAWPDAAQLMAHRLDLVSWLDYEADEDEARAWSHMMLDAGPYTPAMRKAQAALAVYCSQDWLFMQHREAGSRARYYGTPTRHTAAYIAALDY